LVFLETSATKYVEEIHNIVDFYNFSIIIKEDYEEVMDEFYYLF